MKNTSINKKFLYESFTNSLQFNLRFILTKTNKPRKKYRYLNNNIFNQKLVLAVVYDAAYGYI